MRLREMREKAGKSVFEVQKELGVSDAAVYYWENGSTKPKIENLIKLAQFYGCTVDDLLGKEAAQCQN